MHLSCYEQIKLKKVVDVISGYAFPGSKMGLLGSPIIKIKNIIPPTVDVLNVDRIPKEFIIQNHKINKYKIKHKDILIAMTGATVGKIGRFPKTKETFYLNQRVARVDLKSPDHASIDYIYYVLSQSQYTDQIFYLADGSAQANVSTSQIEKINIPLPPLPEQRRIAHILGTLDDKIENNRKTAKTLEAMAQTIFQSWFVGFDPVRAKMAGESPESICKRLKLTPEILDLFPDRLVDSELGEIPEGWEVRSLGSVLSLRREHCNTSEVTMGRPYVPIECISSKSLSLTESKSGLEAQSSLTRFYKNDILFGAMRPYFHKVCIAPFEGTTRTTAFVLYPKSEHDLAFGLFVMFNKDTIDYATVNSTGSTIPYAVWENSLENMSIVMPSEDIRSAFNGVISTLLRYTTGISYHQLTQLKTARDTLLPKLTSGEIRVPEAEHLIEEITV